MPRLSVLLPVRDGQRTIHASVRSTLRAMPRDAELLVVDDGSTDETGAILARVQDRRLRVLRNRRSAGVAASLNAGLRATDSTLVARMDADDVSLPWRFRAATDALERADLVFGSMVLIDDGGRLTGASTLAPVSPAAAPLHLLLENPFAHPTLLGRREAIEAAGGYRATEVEDYDLWLRAAAAGSRLRKLRVPVLAYRRHAGQATQSWRRDAADPLLDESYAALLPPSLHEEAPALRAAAMFRDPLEGTGLSSWIRARAAALPVTDRRPLLRRLRALGG